MKIYSQAPDEMYARVAHLKKLFHAPLFEAGVRIDVLTVADEDGDSCLEHQGYPAGAVVRIVGSKDRVKGSGDAEIVVDEPTYMQLTDASKDALLDHELQHIELKIDAKKNRVKLDENGRPRLGLRKHDYQFGWFHDIAARHGAASIECRQATTLFLAEKQTLFAFAMDEQPALEDGSPANSEAVKNPAAATARKLVDSVRKLGMTMTIKSGNTETTIK